MIDCIPEIILVEYDKTKGLQGKLLEISKVIVERDKIEFLSEEKIWITETFLRPSSTRSDDEDYISGYAQIGFKFKDGNNQNKVVIKYKNEDIELYHDTESGYYFERAKFEYKKNKSKEKEIVFKNHSNIGVNRVGTIYPYILNKNNEKIILDPIKILPSNLTENEYNEMLTDIAMMTVDMLKTDKTSAVNVKFSKFQLIEDLLISIQNLSLLIKEIETLRISDIDIKFSMQSGKRKDDIFDIKREIQKNIFPGKTVVKSKVINKSLNTYENRMIKLFLIKIKKYLSILNAQTIKNEIINLEINEKGIINSKKNNLTENKVLNTKNKINNITEKVNDLLTRRDHVKHNNISNINDSILVEVQLNFIVNKEVLLDHDIIGKSNIINSDFESNWDKEREYYNIEMQNYYFKHDNKNHKVDRSVNKRFSKSFKFNLNGNDISDTLYLQKSIEIINKNLQKQKRVCIIGSVCVNKNRLYSNYDIIGELVRNRYDEYHFKFENIQEITVDDKQIIRETSCQLSNYSSSILNSILNNQIKNYSDYLINSDANDSLKNISMQKDSLENIKLSIESCIEQIDRILRSEFWMNINVSLTEKFKSSLRFMHMPIYKKAFHILKSNESIIKFNDLSFHVDEFAINNLNDIYELWVYYKILHRLLEMNWNPSNKQDIYKFLSSYFYNKNNLDGVSIELEKGSYSLSLINNGKVNVKNGFKKPDFQFIIKRKGTEEIDVTKKIYLDAKNRNYIAQGMPNGMDEWEKDIKDIAIEKYYFMDTIDLNDSADLSFIVHSDTEFKSFSQPIFNYTNIKSLNNSSGQNNVRDIEPHSVGSVGLTPSNITQLNTFIRMIMEYHFTDYFTCWNCGESENITVKQLLTRKKNVKYHIKCESCKDFWVKTHCDNYGHTLIKHSINYHEERKRDNPWMVECPECSAFSTTEVNENPIILKDNSFQKKKLTKTNSLWDPDNFNNLLTTMPDA